DVFLQNYPGASEVLVDTKDPLMRDIVAPMAVAGDTVFIELARCSGLMMIDTAERNPLKTTTYGLGLMLMAALDYSPRQIIVGVGGSATNDGGRGMIEAIGLENIHLFDDIEVKVACDARNPLLGPHGATYTYAPQKGAGPEMLPVLEKRMEEWVVTAREWLSECGIAGRDDLDTVPGGGTAGGSGAALYAFLKATPVHGFEFFSQMVSLEEKIAASRMVITGEGRLDASSLDGKLVGSLAEMCSAACRRLYVVCGQNTLGSDPSICDVALLATDFKEKIGRWCREDWRSDYLPSGGSLFGEQAVSYGLIAGCDEAGRGPLAGPVFAAAVILPEGFYHPLLKDSKKMTAAQRDLMCGIIEREAIAWSVASISAAEIDEINILQASIKAMQTALGGLSARPDLILVDGNRFNPYYGPDGVRIPHKCIVKGDDKVPEISAASILAKTYRDRYMQKIDKEYPQYGWARNMGYPTEEHRAAIHTYGLTPHHRKTFTVK
ncbi:MAG: ribonuclease HII, partial [Bacteroidales bacterium]|nr:ribonuclease HII [Bacteroidales bacterium]